jgi:hypothetical protein
MHGPDGWFWGDIGLMGARKNTGNARNGRLDYFWYMPSLHLVQ